MSAYDLEEQERIAALKDWWEQWKLWVYVGVIAFFVGAVGVLGYRQYKISQSDQAAALFKNVKKTVDDATATKDAKKISEAANTLAEKFPSSFFATDVQLTAAKAAFDSKDYAAAKTHLQWVIDKGGDTHKNVARVRLASVLLEDKKYDDALKALDSVKDDAFSSIAADLRGDIYAVQGKRDEARASYQVAVEKAGDRSTLKSISQAKLDALGGSVVVASAGAIDKAKDAVRDVSKELKGATK